MIHVQHDARILQNNARDWYNVSIIHWKIFLAIIIIIILDLIIIYFLSKKLANLNNSNNKGLSLVIFGFASMVVVIIYLSSMIFQTGIPYQNFQLNPTVNTSYLNFTINSLGNLSKTTPQQMVNYDKTSLKQLSKIKKEQKQIPIIKQHQKQNKELTIKYLMQRNHDIYTRNWQLDNRKYQHYNKLSHLNRIHEHEYEVNITTLHKVLKKRPPHLIA